MKILVGISGASGAHLGVKLANFLALKHDVGVIISQGASFAFRAEKANLYLENSENSGFEFSKNSDPTGCEAKNSISENSENSAVVLKNSALKNSGKILKNSALKLADFLNPKIAVFDAMDAAPASGSSGYEAMIIAPCSTNSLAKIACGISDNLLLRAAAVMLKEKRKLVLAVRELPFSPISLEQMTNLAKIGAIIAPPILAYYSKPQSLEDAENFIIGKWLDALGVENSLFKRWEK